MVGTNKENIPTNNKGVNVHSESLPARAHTFTENESTSTQTPRSMTDIKNEIQNVLDLMGPSTPHLTTSYLASSDADNEGSFISIPQYTKRRSTSEKKNRNSLKLDQSLASSDTTKCSFTLGGSKTPTKTNESEVQDSAVAEVGTISTNFENFEEVEASCCDHNRLVIDPECICALMDMNRSTAAVTPSRICEGTRSTGKSTPFIPGDYKKRGLLEWLKEKSSDIRLKKPNSTPCELYKINVCGQCDDGTHPRRVIFDLVEGIPRPTSSTVATNTIKNPVEKRKTSRDPSPLKAQCPYKDMKNIKNEVCREHYNYQKNICYDSDGNARVDYYYFDHGNAQYFHTTDTPPVLKTEIIAEKTERYTTIFWAEFFASIHIGVAFCVSFLLQLLKFILYSIIRPLLIGMMQMCSDYCLKPFLTTFFNGLIQPLLIFLYNIATSVRDLCDPIAEAVGYFCREIAVVFRAIRFCTYKKNTSDDSINCECNKKSKYEC